MKKHGDTEALRGKGKELPAFLLNQVMSNEYFLSSCFTHY